MARYFIPSLTAAEVGAQSPGIEAILAECHHVAPSALDSTCDERNSFTAVTALINLSTAPGSRESFRPLRHALGFARTRSSNFASGDEASLVGWCTPQQRSDFGCVVIFVDSTTAMSPDQLQRLITRFSEGLLAEFTNVLVVCEEALRWKRLTGVSGYVRGAAATDAATAATLFLAMASDMAPDTITCLDFEDFGFKLDVPQAASVLAEAVWLRTDETLHYASRFDRAAVREANTVAMIPLMSNYKLTELRSLCSALRADLGPEGELRYAAPVNFDPFSFLHERVAAVVLLCSP